MTSIAKQDKVVRDDALGIDRRVAKGQAIPPDLADAYAAAGGTSEDVQPVGPDDVIATETRIVHDDVLGIDRRVIEGTPVPPDLVDAYNASAKSKSSRKKADD